MLWFGGFSGSGVPRHLPLNRRHLWSSVPNVWRVGNGSDSAVRVAHTAQRSVAVIGTCGARPDEVMHLAQYGVTDTVAWRWPGSYTVIQVDDRGTTVWTDLASACPVYYTGTDHGMYWASSARALAGLHGAGVDRDTLAARLLVPGVPALVASRSAFAGVCMVPAGHRLVLPVVGQPEVRSVWQPRPRSGDHPARLRVELSAAVSLRVDTAEHPTADLSGGYDSSALALLAAERLSPDRAMTAVTVHAEGVTDGGDLTYAHLVAEHPGIAHRLLPIGASQLPYSGMEGVPATDEPAPSTVAYARFSAQLDWMREVCRSDSHLTGDGGDTLLCSPPMMLADVILARRYRRALDEALAWSRLRQISALPLLAEAARTARTTREAALEALERAVRMGQASSDTMAAWYSVAAVPTWATSEVRERAVEVAWEAADLAGLWPVRDLTAYVIAEAMAEVGRTARADAQLAEAAGIELHNPFIDSRVVDACLSIPLADRPGPAEYKPILRAAMADLFPAQLARRTTKGSYTSDYYGGIRANLDALSELADGRLADLGLIDPAAFRRTLRLAAAGVQAAYVTVEPVIRTEVWLRAIDAAPAVPWAHQDRQDVQNIPGAA
jgi:asparagine synthase (glutamine-hydrolysing)